MLLKSYAKINLAIDTLYKREDGYHEVEMVMASIDLYDRIELTELSDDRIEITSNVEYIPLDDENHAYKAAMLIKKKYNIKKGIRIDIEKHIPTSAGLAGGSSNAATVLKGLNDFWDLNMNLEELYELGAQIGSDVPYCIYGKMALATGRGEIITPISNPLDCWVVLVKPNFGVSTKLVYDNLDCTKVNHPDIDGMIDAVKKQDCDLIHKKMGNTLESVTLELYPEVKKIKEKMIKFGCDVAMMSGSGPSVFGVIRTKKSAIRIQNALNGFVDGQIFMAKVLR